MATELSLKALKEAEANLNEVERILRKSQYERDLKQKEIDGLEEQRQVCQYILDCLKAAT